jgi:hypothetical protein
MIITKELIQKTASMYLCYLPVVLVSKDGKATFETAIQYELHNCGDCIVKYYNVNGQDYDLLTECKHMLDGKSRTGEELKQQFEKAVQEFQKPTTIDNNEKTNKLNKNN